MDSFWIEIAAVGGVVVGYVLATIWGKPAKKLKELEDRIELALVEIEEFLDRFPVTGDEEEKDG